MTDLINSTTVPGSVVLAMTNDVTGSLFLTLTAIMLLVFFACALFRMPMEVSLIVMLPLIIHTMAVSDQFLAIGGFAAMYAGVLFGKAMLAR
ncbi:MAG: hypothetical protein LC650_01980 [Actinobacteria bacterium]|nr:hypothetical protein [Actinomycetota bacterium]